MGNHRCVDPEQQLLRELLGARVARLVISAPGGWRTLHERELLALGLSEASSRALLALQQLTSSAWPSLAIGSLASADKVAAVYTERLGNLRHEVVLAAAVDGRNHFIEEHTLAMGGAHGAALTARDVFRPLIRAGASGVILVHNHPSGDPKPSREDIAMTRVIAEAGSVLGVELLDHIIVGARGGGWASVFEQGLIEPREKYGEQGKTLQAVCE